MPLLDRLLLTGLFLMVAIYALYALHEVTVG